MNSNIYRKRIYDNYLSAGWDQIHEPGKFDKSLELYQRYFRKNYLPLLPQNKDSNILEIACGMGEFIFCSLKEGYKNIIGIDYSKEQVNFCKSKNFPVKEADANSYLDKKKNSFDVIVFNDFLEHLDKEEIIHFLDKVNLALKKDGIIILKVPNGNNPIINTSSRYIDYTHETIFTEFSLQQVLIACAFEDIKILPQQIYITKNIPLNLISLVTSSIINKFLYVLGYLYGRKSLKIFSKCLIALAKKKE